MWEIIIEFMALVLAFIGAPEPIVLTAYDPELGGINCVEPCGQTASGYWWEPGDYWDGHEGLAACPKEWLGATLVIEGFGTLYCLDRGGAINRYRWNDYYRTFVTHVDVLATEPGTRWWNFQKFENWTLNWP